MYLEVVVVQAESKERLPPLKLQRRQQQQLQLLLQMPRVWPHLLQREMLVNS
jgi:hypothetical protein